MRWGADDGCERASESERATVSDVERASTPNRPQRWAIERERYRGTEHGARVNVREANTERTFSSVVKSQIGGVIQSAETTAIRSFCSKRESSFPHISASTANAVRYATHRRPMRIERVKG